MTDPTPDDDPDPMPARLLIAALVVGVLYVLARWG